MIYIWNFRIPGESPFSVGFALKRCKKHNIEIMKCITFHLKRSACYLEHDKCSYSNDVMLDNIMMKIYIYKAIITLTTINTHDIIKLI